MNTYNETYNETNTQDYGTKNYVQLCLVAVFMVTSSLKKK